MIKLKMIELISIFYALIKIGDNTDCSTPIQFKFKIALLIQNLQKYIEQYNKELQILMKEYEIEIEENKYKNKDKDENKLSIFLEKKYELENIDLEIDQKKIIFDKNVNGISANELLLLMPFFDFSEIMQ